MKYEIKSDLNDLEAISQLVNSAYRGVSGQNRWTTEAHLVAGDRIGLDELAALLQGEGVELILGKQDAKLVCCISIKVSGAMSEFGLFAVEPELHGSGIGKELLAFAEERAGKYSERFRVTVVSQNTNLIQFYHRRGYRVTGGKLPYPINSNVGQPLIDGMDLTVMEKSV